MHSNLAKSLEQYETHAYAKTSKESSAPETFDHQRGEVHFPSFLLRYLFFFHTYDS